MAVHPPPVTRGCASLLCLDASQGNLIVHQRSFIFKWKLALYDNSLFVTYEPNKVVGCSMTLLMHWTKDNYCWNHAVSVFLVQRWLFLALSINFLNFLNYNNTETSWQRHKTLQKAVQPAAPSVTLRQKENWTLTIKNVTHQLTTLPHITLPISWTILCIS